MIATSGKFFTMTFKEMAGGDRSATLKAFTETIDELCNTLTDGDEEDEASPPCIQVLKKHFQRKSTKDY